MWGARLEESSGISEAPSAYNENYTEDTSALSSTSTEQTAAPVPSGRPTRADAARNYDALIAAAFEAFTHEGEDASLEGIARRAGVGIGTLYRNFPTRQALLEAVYQEEVAEVCRAVDTLDGLDPGEALTAWLRRFAEYATTKKALVGELMAYVDSEAPVFTQCKAEIKDAARPLFEAAKEAGAIRADADMMDVIRMVGGIAAIPNPEPGQVDRILALALDGLRPR